MTIIDTVVDILRRLTVEKGINDRVFVGITIANIRIRKEVTQMKKIKGFTLIELLIVVAIIGIIAAIAIPNLLDAIERSRQKRSVGEAKTLGNALQSFSVDYGGYPPTAACTTGNIGVDLDQAQFFDNQGSPGFEPDYIQAIPDTDGWNIPYVWDVGPDGQLPSPRLGDVTAVHFCLASYGSDKNEGGGTATGAIDFTAMTAAWNVNPQGATPGTLQSYCYESDIIWGDSSFLQAPEGKQKHCD